MRRTFCFILLALTPIVVLAGCGDDDADPTSETDDGTSDDAGDSVTEDGSDIDEPVDDGTSDEDAGSGLDPDAIDPCVFTSDEVQTLHELNDEALGSFGTIGPGTSSTDGLNSCDYEVRTDDGMEPTFFRVVVLSSEREATCFVEHRDICLAPGTTYTTEEPASYVVPDEIASAAVARLDAM